MSKEQESKTGVTRPAGIRLRRPVELDTLFDRMFDNSWLRPFSRPWAEFTAPGVELPTMDVYEEKDELVVKAEIPGLDKNEIDVSVTGNILTIKGEKKKEEETKEKDYYRCERSFGAFTRSIELPMEVKTDSVKATFKNGVLEIRLPKSENAKNSVVRVKVA